MDEFALIEKFFKNRTPLRKDVVIGIGDDAALVHPPPYEQLVVTVDTLVSDIHFLEMADAEDIGYKAMAVNLSDLAAMGATPAWATIALTMPKSDTKWLASFSKGFFKLCTEYNVQLMGGNLSQGPLSITVQLMGFTSKKQILKRNNAKPGDLIFVTGTLGDAGLGLKILLKEIKLPKSRTRDYLLGRLHRPTARIEQGKRVLEIANAAIDLSDGLAQDLNHIAEESKVGMTLWLDQIPLSKQLREVVTRDSGWDLAMTAGDDYELCFTVPAKNEALIENEIKKWACPCTCIGVVEAKPGMYVKGPDGKSVRVKPKGYSHF